MYATNTLTEAQIEARSAELRAIRELEKHPGWLLVMKALDEDVLQACFTLADGVLMTEKEVDFRRGAISAARNMKMVLPALIARRENELLMASAQADALKPPTATA